MSDPVLKIGSPVWRYDGNRRVYRKDASGRSIGASIERHHWVRLEITAETSRSWIVTEYGRELFKIPKAKPREATALRFSEEEVDRECWITENAYRVSEAVRRLPYDQLAGIALSIGYEPPAPKGAQ